MTGSHGPGPGPPRFRSWGETQIARLLDRNGLPYLYEHPVAVVDDGKTRIWYPDFQLRGFGLLIEYCGRPDDPDYAAGMARKEAVYRANGLTALMIMADRLKRLREGVCLPLSSPTGDRRGPALRAMRGQVGLPGHARNA